MRQVPFGVIFRCLTERYLHRRLTDYPLRFAVAFQQLDHVVLAKRVDRDTDVDRDRALRDTVARHQKHALPAQIGRLVRLLLAAAVFGAADYR